MGAFGVAETFCVLPRRRRHWQAVAWRRRERFALRLPRLVLLDPFTYSEKPVRKHTGFSFGVSFREAGLACKHATRLVSKLQV